MVKSVWNRGSCSCKNQTPSTRWIVLLFISGGILFLAFWGMDWAMMKQASGQPVQVAGNYYSASEWWNFQWVLVALAFVLMIISAVKLGYMRCRGEI